MRISDWSSDVCSSDLIFPANNFGHFHPMPRQPLKHAGLLGDASPQKGVAAGMFNTHGKVATTVLSGCAAFQFEQDRVRRKSRLGRGGLPDVTIIAQAGLAAKPALQDRNYAAVLDRKSKRLNSSH